VFLHDVVLQVTVERAPFESPDGAAEERWKSLVPAMKKSSRMGAHS